MESDYEYKFRSDSIRFTGLAYVMGNDGTSRLCVRIEENSYGDTYDRGWFEVPTIISEDYYEEAIYKRQQ